MYAHSFRQMALLTLLVVVVAACSSSGPVCNTPYMVLADACCLDKDQNAICDSDELEAVTCEEQEAFDCSVCAPVIVTETEIQERVQLLCEDGETIVDSLDECKALIDPEPIYTPIKSNEDDQSVLESFTVRPACRGGFQGVEIYFKTKTAPLSIKFQTKDNERAVYETQFETTSPIVEKYLYGVFCDSKCTANADFFLSPDEIYLFRGKFDYKETSLDTIIYSNEHIIDMSEDGEYATKLC